MLLDLKFSVGTLGLAMGTFVAGLYGMNLENFIEESHLGFAGVTSASVVFSLMVTWYGLTRLRKVRRVRMGMGDDRGVALSQQHWFRDDGPYGMLDLKNREKLKMMNLRKPVAKRGWLG